MALTREFIRKLAKESDVELPKEFLDGIIAEHTAARDAYADEQVKAELAKQPEQKAVNVKDSEEYKTLKKSFDDYKAEIANKQAKEAKEKAVRAFYESKGRIFNGGFLPENGLIHLPVIIPRPETRKVCADFSANAFPGFRTYYFQGKFMPSCLQT